MYENIFYNPVMRTLKFTNDFNLMFAWKWKYKYKIFFNLTNNSLELY